jgi:hypothetical protein
MHGPSYKIYLFSFVVPELQYLTIKVKALIPPSQSRNSGNLSKAILLTVGNFALFDNAYVPEDRNIKHTVTSS